MIVNEALHAFADSDPLVAVASSKGLESKPDLIHFCSAAQREFGLRHYRAYRTLVPPNGFDDLARTEHKA